MADRYWVGTNTIKTFSISAQESTSQGLFFKPDGTKMYIVGTTGDDVNEYDLITAWDVSTASYLQNFSVSAQEGNPNGLFFKPDGTKMYIIGLTGDDVNEYDLSSAWDVSTASYLQNFSISSQELNPQGLFFKPDGTKMYITGLSGDDVNEYDLSSAWDVSTASYVQNFRISLQESVVTDLFFKSDGTKMYIIGASGDDVNEYDLSSAWDVSTASYVQNFSVSGQETSPRGLFFKSDGTEMYIVGTESDTVYQYPLSSAWDISSTSPDVWDGTAGSKWATTSGGTGGASAPTTSDAVFFDANSGEVLVPISNGNTGAASINCTGFTGEISGLAAITVAGSITLDAGQKWTHTGFVTITGTGTLTTAGKTFSTVVVDGSGITVTLGDALNTSVNRSVTVTKGTFDTANYNFTGNVLASNNSNVRSVLLGSSTLSLQLRVDFTTATNLTFNAGTSQINLARNNAEISSITNSQTFYNVSFTSPSIGTRSIKGSNTFNNLTFNASAGGLSQLQLFADQTVNGTFTCAGSSATQRGFVRSDSIGTTRTITANAISANDCDFRDITIAGTAAGASPTRAGDCGGNSGITFPAAKTVYRVGGSSVWNGVFGYVNGVPQSASWATTSGGTGALNNFPLAQDTAVVDNNTTATLIRHRLEDYNMPAFDCASRTNAITLKYDNSNTWYGYYTLGSGVTIEGTSNQTFSGRGTQTFTSAGKTITFPITVDKPAGTFELGDAFESSNNIELSRGTFDAKNYNVTAKRFVSDDNNTRTLTMGSGVWTLSNSGTTSSSAPWRVANTGTLTFNKDTANIILSNNVAGNSKAFQGGGLSYNKLTIGGNTATNTTDIENQDNSFTELASTKTVAHTIRFQWNNTIDTWSVTGTSGNVVAVNTTGSGIRRTINLTNATSGIDYLNVKDIGITDANKFYVGANSTDSGNNLNVIFTDTPDFTATGNFFTLFV